MKNNQLSIARKKRFQRIKNEKGIDKDTADKRIEKTQDLSKGVDFKNLTYQG